MKKTGYIFLVILTALFLAGFKAGSETVEQTLQKKRAKTTEKPASGPVVEYTETVASEKTPQELYTQYHLLAVSSIEEAVSTFTDNKTWTYRMAHNSLKYVKLLQGLVSEENSGEFSGLLEELKPLVSGLKRRNLTQMQQQVYMDKLKHIAATLEQDFSWEKAKQWITQ
jgi:hypothetical protein